MTGRLKSWFDGRSLRERRLLLVMAGLLVLTIIWAGIIRPVGDGLSAARTRHADAVIDVAQTSARIDTLKTLQRDRPPPLPGPLDAVMRARANEAGFALSSVTPQGADRLQIGITAARPGALVGWIAGLEADGILVDALTITNNGDQTVGAQMTLKARGI